MPSKRSKSEEKKRKQLQRLKLSEEKKMDIREKEAKAKCLKRELQTDQETKERLKNSAEDKKNKMEESKKEDKTGKKRKKRRLGRGIGVEDGISTDWITKKLNNMNVEEKKEYAKQRKRKSRENESEKKIIAQNSKKREYNYERRFRRYGRLKTMDLRETEEDDNYTHGEFVNKYLKWKSTDTKKYPFKLSEFEERIVEKKQSKADQEDKTSDESDQSGDDEPYWMDEEYSEGEELPVADKLKTGELEEEFKAMDKHMKNMKKRELKKPAPTLPTHEKCQYEKIRESIIRDRVAAMEESGLFENMSELKEKIFMEKLDEIEDE